MRIKPNLALFTFAAAAALGACERKTPDTGGNTETPRPLNPTAKGVDAPPEVPTAG